APGTGRAADPRGPGRSAAPGTGAATSGTGRATDPRSAGASSTASTSPATADSSSAADTDTASGGAHAGARAAAPRRGADPRGRSAYSRPCCGRTSGSEHLNHIGEGRKEESERQTESAGTRRTSPGSHFRLLFSGSDLGLRVWTRRSQQSG